MGNFAKGRAHFRQTPQREKTERKRKSGESKVRCRAKPSKKQSSEKENSEKAEEFPGLNPQGEGRSGWEKSEEVGATLPGRIRKRKVEVDGASGRRRSGARGRLYGQPPGHDLNMGDVTGERRAMLPKRLGDLDTQDRPNINRSCQAVRGQITQSHVFVLLFAVQSTSAHTFKPVAT